tara:strand:- start:3671 stop:4501 length:831 start_codon:yes stop_codon:yes gene_type:complete
MSAVMESQQVAPIVQTPDRLIALAIETNADVEKLERLFDLQERYNADIAKKAYFAALSNFQTTCPDVPKNKPVLNRDGSERYRYAPLDAMIKTLRLSLHENGFSWRFEASHIEDCLQVSCTLTHVEGHSEESTVTIPGITGHGTNAAQDEGSGMAYGKRYSFQNVTGITADQDNDGQTAAPDNGLALLAHNKALYENLEGVIAIKDFLVEGGLEAAAEVYAEFTRKDLMDLNVAPSKGGVWTTEERKTLNRDPEFQEFVVKFRNDAGWYEIPANQN